VAKSRKTVDVESLLQYANGYLASDYVDESLDGSQRGRRLGICDFIETILMKADRYKGYRYLDERDMKLNKPGIRLYSSLIPTFTDTDDSRREYY
jgi:hypothetical protein